MIKKNKSKMATNSLKRKREELNIDNFKCTICLDLILEPVTLNCGHNFCKSCLESAPELDSCPNCREHICCGMNLSVNKYLEEILTSVLKCSTEGDEYMRRYKKIKKQRDRESLASNYTASDRYEGMLTYYSEKVESQPYCITMADLYKELEDLKYEKCEIDYFIHNEVTNMHTSIIIRDKMVDIELIDEFFVNFKEKLSPDELLYIVLQIQHHPAVSDDCIEHLLKPYENFQNKEFKYLQDEKTILRKLSKSDQIRKLSNIKNLSQENNGISD